MGRFAKWVLQQAVVEVQYARGWSYYDKCGSLVLALEDALGKPFTGNVPGMEHGEVKSAAERITVSYGPKSFNLVQQWIPSAARVEHLAPIAWDLVAETLAVSRHVTRCGVRFIFAGGAETLDEASAALAACPLVGGSPEWKALVGGGAVRSHSSVIEDERGRQRVALDVQELALEGQLPPDLAKIVPKFSILLDVDNVQPGQGTRTLSKSSLKDFIRTSWQRTRTIATVVGGQLGIPNE